MTIRFTAKNDPTSDPAEDTYEVAAFAAKYGLPTSEAKTILKRYGPSKRKLDAHMAARNV